jgi:hypothetical protein
LQFKNHQQTNKTIIMFSKIIKYLLAKLAGADGVEDGAYAD